MAPIRLGIIGLSATNVGSWASVAHLPYLLSPRGKAHYRIVALCNSSVESARLAIETFQLPPETRAYGSPNDLAQDTDVDFVVCSTRVDKHYETIKPSIVAGKAVFVEWPLASNISQVRELAGLVREQGIRSLVGLQGRVTAPIDAVRGILEQGRIGKVLSSEVKASGGAGVRDAVPQSLKYFTQLKTGGNMVMVGFGHCKLLLLGSLGVHARCADSFQCGSSSNLCSGMLKTLVADFSCSVLKSGSPLQRLARSWRLLGRTCQTLFSSLPS